MARDSGGEALEQPAVGLKALPLRLGTARLPGLNARHADPECLGNSSLGQPSGLAQPNPFGGRGQHGAVIDGSKQRVDGGEEFSGLIRHLYVLFSYLTP